MLTPIYLLLLVLHIVWPTTISIRKTKVQIPIPNFGGFMTNVMFLSVQVQIVIATI